MTVFRHRPLPIIRERGTCTVAKFRLGKKRINTVQAAIHDGEIRRLGEQRFERAENLEHEKQHTKQIQQ